MTIKRNGQNCETNSVYMLQLNTGRVALIEYQITSKRVLKLSLSDERRNINVLAVRPKALQAIKGSGFLHENMDDNAAVIKKNPSARAIALAVKYFFAVIFQNFFNLVAERFNLS